MKELNFGDNYINLHFEINDDSKINIFDVPTVSLTEEQKTLLTTCSNPLELQISGRRTWQHTGARHIFTSETVTLKYINHKITDLGSILKLEINQENDLVKTVTYYDLYKESHTIRCYSKVTNISKEPLTIEYISSFAKKDIIGYNIYNETYLSIPSNAWFLECQWNRHTLQELGIVLANDTKSFSKYIVNNTGCWSTKSYLPMGMLSNAKNKRYILWQIEANGSWSYELGNFINNVTLNLSGPCLEENGCAITLKPNECFNTVKAAITEATSENECFANITRYRRSIVAKKPDFKHNPIIFNEYMLASWNHPTEESARELAPIAKKLGAEYYVIDCGWHDEEENPFYYVGKWKESKTKYPHGLNKTLDYIRSLGLKPGLWLEPEVVGYWGDAKDIWDEDCYFHRFNKRLIISDRYQLDFSNPKVPYRLSKLIDELVEKYHIEYFKFDYNIEPGIGFEKEDCTLGEALLLHNRAYYSFVKNLTLKYPNIIFESCASGGNRLDYLTMDTINLVSTSDQDHFSLYPYIISNVLSSTLPEQAGIWCYPKRNEENENISFEDININLLNAMIGRIHLASKLYLLSEDKLDFIKKGLTFYHTLDSFKENAIPYWPNGFSKFNDDSLAFGLKNDNIIYLWVYAMKNTNSIIINLNNISKVEVVFPYDTIDTKFDFSNDSITFYPKEKLTARLFKITLSK